MTHFSVWEHVPFILQILTWRSSAPDTMRGMLGWKAAQFTPRSWPWDQSKRTQTFIQANNKIHSTPISTKKTTTTTFLPPEHVSLQHQTRQTGRHQRCRAPLCPQHPETSSSFSDLEATFIVRHTQGTRYKLHRNTHIPGREKRGTTLKLLLKDAWCETANTQTFCWAAKHSLVLENTNTTYVLH